MQRWFRALIFAFALLAVVNVGQAQQPELVSGLIGSNEVRCFVKDKLYTVDGALTVSGTLIIEPGTNVEFKPNGRLIVAAGGRVIADGRVTATYNNPFDPFVTEKAPGQLYTGYADLDYFANASVTTAPNINEPTVNVNKALDLFRVNLSDTDSRLRNLTVGKALLYKLSRIDFANSDPNINQRPWKRLGDKNVNVVDGRITFRASKVNDFSREWGHIVVLPGAKCAYFRDVDFRDFRKDTTVDRRDENDYYTGNQAAEALNARMSTMTNGSGGALTTFTVRTWLVNCNFEDNMARYHGGAVQFLQAPLDNFGIAGAPGVYPDVRGVFNSLPFYPLGTNPNVTDNETGAEINQQLRAIDNLRNPSPEPFSDFQRQMVDDARLAVYLGRVRRLSFRNNMVLVANNGRKLDNGVPVGLEDKLDEAANVDAVHDYKNEAFGGAVYINGRNHMIVSLGNNDGFAPEKDFVLFEGNRAINLQSNTPNNGKVTSGARGGAVYVGDNTSVIFAGRFANNATELGFNPNIGDYSQGGAIYASANAPYIHIRGGRNLIGGLESHFVGNSSGRGGAIYSFLLTPTNSINLRPSPAIGGSDLSLVTRDYGYNIKFLDNTASHDGGAIYTTKQTRIYGAGGTVGTSVNYSGDYRVEFRNNSAGHSGGAISINIFGNLSVGDRQVEMVRAIFQDNVVGEEDNFDPAVKGGGAIYAFTTDLREIRAVEFLNNSCWYGNGGAIALVNLGRDASRFFATDLDDVTQSGLSVHDATYTYNSPVPADTRSLTRFLGNVAVPNPSEQGSGATQEGDVARMHPGTNMAENGTGLGGALYILDRVYLDRADYLQFNRVRFQDNEAYSGAVVYSDNYDLQIAFQRCLVTGNVAHSDIGAAQNAISGPYVNDQNPASSDLAGAVFYGEIVGPEPWVAYHTGANAIYENSARFLIRLPDAPNTKGANAGTGLGFGKLANVQGNYWGRTEANVNTIITQTGIVQKTFFVAGSVNNELPYVLGGSGKEQGPFEFNAGFTYQPIPVNNDPAQSIPESLLMQGHVYDLFDKGTDIKSVDYANRRMARIEDYAVGVPPVLSLFDNDEAPSYQKAIKRWTRDPFVAEADASIASLQTEWVGAHPIGYPLFLEASADYSGDVNRNNNDDRAIHETTFFVINENTGDYIRVNLAQVDFASEVFRGRCEFVPDSGNRYFNPLERRTAEGLANFGGGASLLQNLSPVFLGGDIYTAAKNEDEAALQGRKYIQSAALLGGGGFRYSNRPGLPASTQGSAPQYGNQVTYFGGERFSALPVRVGDTVRVISRTVLWKEGVNEAINRGLKFAIGASTQPPVFTGSKIDTENNQIEGYTPPDGIDLIFVSEDVDYPQANSDNHPGRDDIFSITARDTNQFWDPRSIADPDSYTQLEYEWEVAPGSGLSYWLESETIYNEERARALGYIEFKGRPTNPFIVPGGEVVTVRARNWAPHRRTIDSLRAAGFSEEEIAKHIYLYRSYFSSGTYDTDNARFLQQDTVNYGFDNEAEYKFRILVTDSIPVFEQEDRPCNKGGDTLLASVVTGDFLRFSVDINTDDEREDADAATRGWDFRYGKTSYGFEVVDLRPEGGLPGDTIADGVHQIRPSWLASGYLLDADGNPDPNAAAFTSTGLLNTVIPYNEAVSLLTPEFQSNGSLITDTLITVVVSDGHGGLNTRTYPILINFAPQVTTETLERAIEDEDYNDGLLQEDRAISFFDPNFGQQVTYRLLYEGDQGEEILKDECYPEAGNWNDIVSTANTPEWLKIDPVSGRLYGTPGVMDAPRLGNDAETVTVLITDPCGLTHVKQIPLEVESVNHPPHLFEAPPVVCVEENGQFSGTFTVADIDLPRPGPGNASEQITLSVSEPASWTVTPNTINGPSADSVEFTVQGPPPPSNQRNPDGTVTVVIIATDKAGLSARLEFRIAVSQPTNFISYVDVANNIGAKQTLIWGTANNATTGKDQDAGGLGKLDSNYCEFEVPPIPPTDVFDARWTIPHRRGIVRNIVPVNSTKEIGAIFQAGGEGGGSTVNYPVRICWSKSRLQKPADGMDFFIRDGNTKGNRFLVNMREPRPWNRLANDVELVEISADSVCIVILNSNINSFEIIKDSSTVVSVWEDENGESLLLAQNTPNPFNGVTDISFRVPEAGNVTLEVFDAIGNKVATLANDYYMPGTYSVKWNGKNLSGREVADGVYIYRMTYGAKSVARRMLMMR